MLLECFLVFLKFLIMTSTKIGQLRDEKYNSQALRSIRVFSLYFASSLIRKFLASAVFSSLLLRAQPACVLNVS